MNEESDLALIKSENNDASQKVTSSKDYNDNNKNLYTIEGYDAFPNVRCDGCRGGGLSVYISNIFKSKVIHPCTISLPTTETLFIETVKENCWLLIILIYRPPNANAILFIDKLSELMSIISGNG